LDFCSFCFPKEKIMKWFSRIPVLIRVILYFGICETLVFLSQLVTGFFSFRGPVATNLLLCILLLWVTRQVLRLEGLSWAGGGLQRSHSNFRHLSAGILTGMAMLAVVALVIQHIVGFSWRLNPAFSWWQFPSICITVFCSAFAQELAFRGYPFFLMLHKWGEWPAQLVTALFFGCMHLHEGMSGQAMLLAIFTTGIGSMLFGMAAIRTGNISLAAGIHFGWNFLQYLLPRSPGENGKGIWIVAGGQPSLAGVITYIGPYVFVAIVVYFILRRSTTTYLMDSPSPF